MRFFIMILFIHISYPVFSQLGSWGYFIIYEHDTIDVIDNEFDYTDTLWVCKGDSVQFMGYSDWDASFWHWYIIGGTPSYSEEQNPIIYFNTLGSTEVDYWVGWYLDPTDSAGVINMIQIHVKECLPEAYFNLPAQVCANDCINIEDMSENYPSTYQWIFEGANPEVSTEQSPTNICYENPGVYSIQQIVCNNAGCDTSQQYITVNPSPEGETVNKNYTIGYGESIVLDACATGDNYTWMPAEYLSCSDCTNPTASPMLPEIYYTATVSNTNGCSIYCYYNIQITNIPSDIFVPNTFTPNGDGLNDVFLIPENYIQLLSFQIYDRWGEKLFETTDIHTGWDGTVRGKHALPGVYAYFISYKIYNGGIEYMKTGNITLIR